MNFKKILGLCTIAACLGCVTLLKGTEQLVTINSNVDGATITLDGMVTVCSYKKLAISKHKTVNLHESLIEKLNFI